MCHIFFIHSSVKWPSSKNLQTINAGEDVGKREPSCTVGGNVNWYSHYGEKWWVLRIFKDMQTQITKTYQLTAARRAISINAANNKCWRDCGEMRTLDSKGEVVRATNENTKKVLWKGKHGATSQSITPTAGPITWENENQKVTGWQSCTPTIFTIATTWKQWKCPSTKECTK